MEKKQRFKIGLEIWDKIFLKRGQYIYRWSNSNTTYRGKVGSNIKYI